MSVKEDERFNEFVKDFFEGYFRRNPVEATWIGDHRFDGELDDMSPPAIQEEIDWLRSRLRGLGDFKSQDLNQELRIDYEILKNKIEGKLFNLEVLKGWEKNPLSYNYLMGGSLNALINREFSSLDERMKSLIQRLEKLPRLLHQAKENLKNPPRIHSETVIRQNQGIIHLIEKDLSKAVEKTPELKKKFQKESERAVAALKDYQDYLEKDLLPRSKGDFRLGRELFEKKLSYTLHSTLDPDEILQRAQSEYKRVRKDMLEIALPLHNKIFPSHKHPETGESLINIVVREVQDEIARDHPKGEELLEVCRKTNLDLEKFVKERELISLSDDQPLEVKWTPEFSRGVAGAGLDSPGPLEKHLKSYYYVSPIPGNWTKDEEESFLKEYNNEMIKVLSIHEAIPGHYVQLYYSNRYPSMVRSVFGSGSFIEGWAVYTERMMIDSGYDNYNPKLKLQQLKFYLRGVINTILDNKIHTEGMPEEEALTLMIDGGFQEESEARGKWRRACLTSTQLSTYFVGVQEILDLERDYRKRAGEGFTQKAFNESLLSHGSPPVKFLRELLLNQ
jgi:uncharacterized protein (DUF885 family)